jgi:hypothetical protein
MSGFSTSVSSRAAQTARDLAVALVASFSLRKHNTISDAVFISAECDLRPVERSLAACAARDDSSPAK